MVFDAVTAGISWFAALFGAMEVANYTICAEQGGITPPQQYKTELLLKSHIKEEGGGEQFIKEK